MSSCSHFNVLNTSTSTDTDAYNCVALQPARATLSWADEKQEGIDAAEAAIIATPKSKRHGVHTDQKVKGDVIRRSEARELTSHPVPARDVENDHKEKVGGSRMYEDAATPELYIIVKPTEGVEHAGSFRIACPTPETKLPSSNTTSYAKVASSVGPNVKAPIDTGLPAGVLTSPTTSFKTVTKSKKESGANRQRGTKAANNLRTAASTSTKIEQPPVAPSQAPNAPPMKDFSDVSQQIYIEDEAARIAPATIPSVYAL
ncbi:hypothetical protein SVAN01_10840 [Stagonosporopsis vannaccii]|nr:hypothetical protein SVAN01_10840 [Stagonosporopsis vannaccii]